MNRIAPVCLAAAGLVIASAGGAAAQSRCGATYEFERGDTLYSVAQRCRVTLARIMDLNPALGDPRDISVGTDIRLEPRATDGGQRAGDDRADAPETYRVQAGDTLFSIAQEVGVSLMELMAENPELDPLTLALGEVLNVPGEGPGATISVSPSSVAPGDTVSVNARNLRPHDWVTVGAGPWASEWSALREAQVDPDGMLSASVEVPDWADPGDDLIFVVDTDRGVTLKSDVIDIVPARDDRPDRLALEGRVGHGPECHTLRTPEGETWSMVSDRVRFTEGEYVEVTGRRAEASFCMRGVGTIEVSSIEEVPPPDRGRDGDRVMLEGRVGQGVECHTIKTPAGEIWAVVSDDVEFTPGEYVEVTGREAEMSICMQGQGTIEVSTMDEVSPR